MRRLLVTLAALAMTGCAGMPRAEYGWQALHAVDTYQTMSIAENPECWRENDPLTKRLIGEHPSTAEVAAVMLAYSVGHAYVSKWLEEETDEAFATDSSSRGAWYIARGAWHVVGIATKLAVVVNNDQIGLGPVNKESCR